MNNKGFSILLLVMVACFTISSIGPILTALNTLTEQKSAKQKSLYIDDNSGKYVSFAHHSNPSSTGQSAVASQPVPSIEGLGLKNSRKYSIGNAYAVSSNVGSGGSAGAGKIHTSSSARQISLGSSASGHSNPASKGNRNKGGNSGIGNVDALVVPSFNFRSTSPMLAVNNTTSEAVTNESDIPVLRRKDPADPGEPFPTPVGDLPWALMLIAVAAFAAIRGTKRRETA